MAKKKSGRGDSSVVGDRLRKAIAASERSHNSIGVQAGVAASVVHRFMAGEREPRIATLEKIAKAVGYRIKLVKE